MLRRANDVRMTHWCQESLASRPVTKTKLVRATAARPRRRAAARRWPGERPGARPRRQPRPGRRPSPRPSARWPGAAPPARRAKQLASSLNELARDESDLGSDGEIPRNLSGVWGSSDFQKPLKPSSQSARAPRKSERFLAASKLPGARAP